MQTQTNTAETYGTQPDTLKTEILAALHRFIRQRPGLDYGNYGDPVAYRAELRGITRDLKEAETLLRRVELCPSITGRDLLEIARHSGGRLKIEATPSGVKIDYTTNQYFSTEYRPAVARFCASVLWDWVRDKAMPSPVYAVEWKNERGEWVETGKSYDNLIMAEMAAKVTREQLQREALTAFETPPPRYGETMIVERYRFAGLSRAISGGDWLRRYFRREFGRGIASRWFN
jgi:hypothetical protein